MGSVVFELQIITQVSFSMAAAQYGIPSLLWSTYTRLALLRWVRQAGMGVQSREVLGST